MFFLFRLKSLKELVEKLPALSRLIKMQVLLEWLQLLLLKHSISISIDTPSLKLPLNTEVKFFKIFYVGLLVLTTSWGNVSKLSLLIYLYNPTTEWATK
ncbi:hypothetical protein BCU69_14520 [Vibrio cyclitrophicus]|nr:hypothetical protein BCU69_14520 [Vibrio cyclitrophicus]PMH77472.1 hypothetical protein BCU59_00610 [Vibrio cyclitrophicus]